MAQRLTHAPTPPPVNRPLTIFSIPQEIRDAIWDKVLENARTWVKGYTDQPQGQVFIRRFISEDFPESHPSTLRLPRHPLEYVHSQIAYEFRSRWQIMQNPDMFLAQMQLIPAGMFNGILHLSIEMRQAMYTMQVAIPLIPTPFNPNPPNTPLVLTNAPQLQNLDLYWPLQYDNPNFGIHHTVFEYGLARLQYFHRSFSTLIRFTARKNGIICVSGTLLNPTGNTITNHIPGIEHNYNSYGLDPRDEYTNLRNTLSYITQNLLSGPNVISRMNAYLAITEAQIWHDYVPLGYVRGLQDGRLPVVIAPLRNTPRPYDS